MSRHRGLLFIQGLLNVIYTPSSALVGNWNMEKKYMAKTCIIKDHLEMHGNILSFVFVFCFLCYKLALEYSGCVLIHRVHSCSLLNE